MYFIWNYKGELKVKGGKAYDGDLLVAEYKDGEFKRYKNQKK